MTIEERAEQIAFLAWAELSSAGQLPDRTYMSEYDAGPFCAAQRGCHRLAHRRDVEHAIKHQQDIPADPIEERGRIMRERIALYMAGIVTR